MEEKKITNKEQYLKLKKYVWDGESEKTTEQAELLDFIESRIALIDNKAEKAREKAAEKKAAGDELRAVVKSVLTNEFQTADEITAQIEGEDVSRAKIIARLGQLVKNEEAIKTDVKLEDKRTVKAYKLAD